MVGAFALAGCSAATRVTTPDATSEDPTGLQAKVRDRDAVVLATLAHQAAQQARQVSPDAVLRQVDLKSVGSQYTFRFADYTMVRDVEVFVPAEQSPSEDYEVMLLDSVYWAKGEHPGLELGALRVGPAAAVKAASDYWHGCNLRALWVFGQGQELFWYVSCELPEGVETGTVDSQSGVYQPWSAPPAPTPPTATPIG